MLDNFDDLYLDYATEKECSFKSTLVINEKLYRLIVTDLKMWTKDAACKKRALDQIIKLKLGTISHQKNLPIQVAIPGKNISDSQEAGMVITKDLLYNSYLDMIIDNFLNYSGDVEETIEESTSDILVVSFKTAWKNTNEQKSRVLGSVVFDKKTKAIIEFSRDIELQNNHKNNAKNTEDKKYRYKIENQFVTYHFNKKTDGKYSLKTFTIGSKINLMYDKMLYNI